MRKLRLYDVEKVVSIESICQERMGSGGESKGWSLSGEVCPKFAGREGS